MKKTILFVALGNNSWIGGLYYIKNIVYSLVNNTFFENKYNIVIYTSSANEFIFNDLGSRVTIKVDDFKNNRISQLSMLIYCIRSRVQFIYPVNTNLKFFGLKSISWIPDFQHNYYPNLFSTKELKFRNTTYKKIAQSDNSLVISSQSAFNDFVKFYGSQNNKIRIVRFVSYIEPIIRSLTYERECRVLQKYNIYDSKYICVMNQFWQHKNHIVILEAMKIFFQKNPGNNLKFVFTGKLEDYRCPDYIEKLKKLFEEEFIKQHSIFLGFIDRDEQIAIMKNAEYVIQPSLFEGWGTVVEDAKVLDKTILLSDIPVHREQMNNKCILFDPHNAQQLADLIKQENSKEHHDDIEAGIADMKARAKEYSKGFQELLEL